MNKYITLAGRNGLIGGAILAGVNAAQALRYEASGSYTLGYALGGGVVAFVAVALVSVVIYAFMGKFKRVPSLSRTSK